MLLEICVPVRADLYAESVTLSSDYSKYWQNRFHICWVVYWLKTVLCLQLQRSAAISTPAFFGSVFLSLQNMNWKSKFCLKILKTVGLDVFSFDITLWHNAVHTAGYEAYRTRMINNNNTGTAFSEFCYIITVLMSKTDDVKWFIHQVKKCYVNLWCHICGV